MNTKSKQHNGRLEAPIRGQTTGYVLKHSAPSGATAMRKDQQQDRGEQSSQDTGSSQISKGLSRIVQSLTRNFKWLGTSNPKTLKGLRDGYVTATLSFAPSNFSGKQVCYRDKLCRDGCLFWQGRGRMYNIQDARINKTLRYFSDPDRFASQISIELMNLMSSLESIEFGGQKFQLACRLNNYSDIRWESKKFKSLGNSTIIDMFPDVQFYDYTKYPYGTREAWENPTDNYHLTYSFDGTEEDEANAKTVLEKGHNVCVVYNKIHYQRFTALGGRRGRSPLKWGYRMLDNEVSDNRFLDPSPAVMVGLEKGSTTIST